jgi:hypothetical protein
MIMDKRKNNGGNSTVSKGFDGRKNQYKDILEQSLTPDNLKDVVTMLFDKSTKDKDVNAAKILLEYYLGKPTQTILNENINYKEEDLTTEKLELIRSKINNAY